MNHIFKRKSEPCVTKTSWYVSYFSGSEPLSSCCAASTCVSGRETTPLPLCPHPHRVSLDPTAQRMVGVLRYYLSQFSPKYKKGSVVDDSVPEALQKPLAQ